MLSERFGEYFGFTESEVKKLLQDDNNKESLAEIKAWYNGYQIGKNTLYNPWSIINCIDEKYKFKPYWLNTSDNALIKKLIVSGKSAIKTNLISLLQGEIIKRPLKENLIFPNLMASEEAIWALMHASGYLNAIDGTTVDYDENVQLSIPNQEIGYVYSDMVKHWFTDTKDLDTYKYFISSLKLGNIDEFKLILSSYILESGSYFDFNANTPEQVFHTFMLGLVIGFRDDYVITSNLESGFGRYDLALVPKDKTKQGILLEFKVANSDEDLVSKSKAAMNQIKDKKYTAMFSQHNIKSVLLLGLVFCGKKVEVASEVINL